MLHRAHFKHGKYVNGSVNGIGYCTILLSFVAVATSQSFREYVTFVIQKIIGQMKSKLAHSHFLITYFVLCSNQRSKGNELTFQVQDSRIVEFFELRGILHLTDTVAISCSSLEECPLHTVA